jgi:hypothetical protein
MLANTYPIVELLELALKILDLTDDISFRRDEACELRGCQALLGI